MLAALGDVPQKEALQDLFWSTLILPEFQFIYWQEWKTIG